MRTRQPMILAVVAGLLATALAGIHLEGIETELRAGSEMVRMVVTTEDVAVNSVLAPEMVTVTEIARRYLPADAVAEPARVVGQRLGIEIPKGNPVLASYMSQHEPALSFEVPRLKRAVTVAVDDVTGVAGLVRPGDHVDVLAVFEAGPPEGEGKGQASRAFARTVLQDVQVLANGHRLTDGPVGRADDSDTARTDSPEKVRNLTLVLDPLQAQQVLLAQHIGALAVVLRPSDDQATPALPTTLEKEVTLVETPIRRPGPPQFREIRMMTGGR